MIGAESAKECSQCGQTKPLAEFYTRKDRGGRRVHFNKCKSCYAPANRRASSRVRQREKAALAGAAPPPPPPPAPVIPLSDRVERIRRDAADLVFILNRYVLRHKNGVHYLRLRPNENDPKRRPIALAVERLVAGVWDAGLGNAALGLGPVDPRTNSEIKARAQERG